tara:strand:+ start:1826 stop:2236 length:411 start_codon:yes stop_codon:yes gene_type:complete
METKSYKIFIFGNVLVDEDSIPLKLLPNLKQEFEEIEFVEIDPTEDLPEEEQFIIIDTIINISEVKVLNDIDKIESMPNYSLHDFDLGFNLKLMKKLGKVKEVTIIGVPVNMEVDKSLESVKKIISNLLLRNELHN